MTSRGGKTRLAERDAHETGREVRLVSRRPVFPAGENFVVADVDVPEPGAGQLLVRNTFISVDPYMRGRMSAAPSYVADARFPVGSVVLPENVG
jgi:NADPH-dependent curcumin reductase CurA